MNIYRSNSPPRYHEAEGIVRSRSLRPCLSYSERALGFFAIREGYDGERIRTVDPNGKLQIRYIEKRRRP
jgi:hypothetical protein